MTYFNKRNPWFWAFVILLIINVSAIGTMVYTINKIHGDFSFSPPPKENKIPTRMGRIMEKEMGYSKKQMITLRTIRMEHLKNMREYKTKLRKLQMELFDEISSQEPDEQKTKILKEELLKTHALMIDESNIFYNKVKENSSKEQMKKMNRFYKKMLFHHQMPPIHNQKLNK